MSYKKIAVIVVLVLAIIIGGGIYIRGRLMDQANIGKTIPGVTDLSESYKAEEETAAAMEKLNSTPPPEPSEVITTLTDGTKRVAIVFDGLPDRPLTLRLLDVLKKHNAEATFFVEGENAADQPETLLAIRKANQEVGNYTFTGLAHAEPVDKCSRMRELCRTQQSVTIETSCSPKVFRAPRSLRMETSCSPTVFRAPLTIFGDDILRVTRAAGIPFAVKESVRFQPGNIHSVYEANRYAATIPNGSIIAIPIGHPVEPLAYAPQNEEIKEPAFDKKPTIKDDYEKAPREEKPDLADELDWLLTALDSKQVAVVSVQQFRKIRYVPAGAATVTPTGNNNNNIVVQ